MTFITSFFDNLNTKRIILIFFSLGLLIYGNSLFNSFVGDDFGQIKNNRAIRSISVWSIPSLFGHGTFYSGDDAQKQQQNYYKPILSSAFAVIFLFSRDHPFGFHLIQILIHITNSVLIYLILKHFFKEKLSFLLSLIWLIHPLNTEAVVYISALQEPLFLLFGLLALHLSMREYISLFSASLIAVLLTLSLLAKETGILFLLIVPLFGFLYHKRSIMRVVVPGCVAFLIYAFLRFGVAQIYFPQNIIVPIQTLPFWDRVVHIPKIIFFYLSTFVYPKDLFVLQSWTIKSLTLQDFYIPLLVDAVFFSAILFGLRVYRKHRALFKTLLCFFIWFSIGLGIHLQLVPLGQTVSDRWFYFPMIGLLGIIGILITYLSQKKLLSFNLVIPIILVVLVMLSIRVIIRNMNWKDPLTLYTHDLKINPDNYQIERALGAAYSSQGKFGEAEDHYRRAISLFPGLNSYSSLGILYLKTNRFAEAEEAYETALKYGPNHVPSWIYLAISKYKGGNKEGALAAIKKAHTISPSETTRTFLKVIENDGEINF